MGLCPCREGCDLLVPDMYPFDLAMATKRIREPVEAIADDAEDSFDSSRDEDFRELIRHCSGHAFRPFVGAPRMGPISDRKTAGL